MKKYPVIYKGKEYEVRWEFNIISTDLVIYEVKTNYIFGKIKRKTYKEKYRKNEMWVELEKETILSEKDPNYYIKEVKMLFKMWEAKLKEKEELEETYRIKEQALAEWDGVIDE